MAHAYSAGGSRRTAVFTAIIGLHTGVFLAIIAGPQIRPPIDLPWKPGPITILPKPPPPTPVQPRKPGRHEDFRYTYERPELDFPEFKADDAPVVVKADAVAAGTSAGSGPVAYQQASLRTRDQRVAALVAACYPAASRRLGEEGRAVARVAIDARGAVRSWSMHASSGFPRLDAAMGCVIRHLEFVPARRDGQGVAAEVLLPIVFRLD